MRVLMLSDYFPPHIGGGVEKVVSELCAGLVRRGHTVAVATLRTRSGPAVERIGALTIHRIPAIDLTARLGMQQALSLKALSSIFRIVRRFQPEVIHAHNLFFRTTEVASLLRAFFRIPLVTTLHLGNPEGNGRLLGTMVKAYEATVGAFVVRQSDHVIAVSKAVAQHAQAMRAGSTPITVIPNGVDARVFHPRANGNGHGQTVLFAGRLVPNKGPAILLQAASVVLGEHPQARFVIVGDGPLRSRLEDQARALDIASSVEFTGIRNDMPHLMRDASVFVRPSTLEGMPLTVLEAMATALPVVATPVGGTPEIVHDSENGYLVPVGDSLKLARAIGRLLEDRSLAERLGRRGRQIVEAGHSWDAVVTETERVYVHETSHT